MGASSDLELSLSASSQFGNSEATASIKITPLTTSIEYSATTYYPDNLSISSTIGLEQQNGGNSSPSQPVPEPQPVPVQPEVELSPSVWEKIKELGLDIADFVGRTFEETVQMLNEYMPYFAAVTLAVIIVAALMTLALA